MESIEIILITLTFIELCHLIIRVIKLIPERMRSIPESSNDEREPPIDKNILQTMYC